jgi:CubicO group peptidase (beta-lactamase class C family)
MSTIDRYQERTGMPIRQRLITLSLCAAIAASPAGVHGASTFREIRTTGATTDTTISGFDAGHRTPKQPGDSAILAGLELDETGDKPCLIVSHWWRFTNADDPQEFTTEFDICGHKVDGDKSIVFADARANKVGVRAIQVCNNGSNNHRLKGVKIFGATIDKNSSGKVESNGTSESFERTNCNPPWKATRECPDNQIAVGLLIEHSDDEITGLGLRCAPVVVIATNRSAAAVYAEMEADIRVQTDRDGSTTTMTLLEAIAKHEVAGASVAIIDGGQVALVRHYGDRNAKDNLPTNGDTIYQTASISKLFGGLAMARAARLKVGPGLDTTVQQSADAHPDSLIAKWAKRKFDGKEKDYPSEIDVRRLMGHSAGLSNSSIGNSRADNRTELETVLMGDVGTDSTRPKTRPGTEYCYSGGGVSAAEAMLLAEGLTPRTFLNEMLAEWGLTKSTFNDAKDGMGNLARGCSRGVCSTNPKHTETKFAGGLLGNPEEYARVLTFLINDGKDSKGKQVIPLADVQAVLTPTFHRSSSLRSCASSSCPSGETCIAARCMSPFLADCDGGKIGGYGLGTGVSADDLHTDGYPETLSHAGGNPDGDSATYFFADRDAKSGVVIMVNGEYKWGKNGVDYGSDALVPDIKDAYFRHF